MKILISMLGGIGDTLMLSMVAKRIKDIYPSCDIVASVRKDKLIVLDGNPHISKVIVREVFSDLPVFSKKYDAIIDLKYVAKTYYTGDQFDFDSPAEEIIRRQKEFELELYVTDLPFYRMRTWQDSLQRIYDNDSLSIGKENMNWYSILSYFSGLNLSTKDLYISKEEVKDIPSDFIAVSSPPVHKLAKHWRPDFWNKVFESFPEETFVLLGIMTNRMLQGKNVIHKELSFNIHQTADVISKSKFLISEEGGLVHVAKAVDKEAIVLFGPTQKWFFGYKDNVNLKESFNECHYCHNKHPFWEKRCLGGKSPYCTILQKMTPDVVIEEIKKCLT